MKVLRVLTHGIVLALLNFAGIIVGFGAYHFMRPTDQIAVQAPVATVFSVGVFLIWGLLIRRVASGSFSLRGAGEYIATFLVAFVWAPFILVPFHYLARGHLTSLGNVIGMWIFQVPANLLALLAVSALAGVQGGGPQRSLTSRKE